MRPNEWDAVRSKAIQCSRDGLVTIETRQLLKILDDLEAAEARVKEACTLRNNCVCDDCLNYGRVRRGR